MPSVSFLGPLRWWVPWMIAGCIVKYSEVIRKEGFEGELHRREGMGGVLSGQVDVMIFLCRVLFRIVLE